MVLLIDGDVLQLHNSPNAGELLIDGQPPKVCSGSLQRRDDARCTMLC